jgi:dephospho-CoA kinase
MVGLTGGIGSGKSMVAHRMAERGAVLIDADQVAREVVRPGTEGLRAVIDAFGAELLAPDGTLDRAALGSRVFGDEAARRRLEGIIHPRVRARTRELTEAAPPDSVVVNDVPLLAEAGLAATYHLVLTVQASEATRVDRLRGYRGMSEADAYARIRAQATDEQRRAVADVVLANESTVDDLLARVDRVWDDRLVPYQENVRLRRPARFEERPIVGYDPTWPAAYARLAVRIAHAAEGRRVDHVGPTAVPGLPAVDVIDVQLTVDAVADADRLAGALAEAGFPRIDGMQRDASMSDDPEMALDLAQDPVLDPALAPAPDQAQWEKRTHGSADPGRQVRLHVRVTGSPGWRAALLLRDWLRADPQARRDYAKQEYTKQEDTKAGKPGLADLWPRAQEWARSTGWQPARPS